MAGHVVLYTMRRINHYRFNVITAHIYAYEFYIVVSFEFISDM